MRRIEDPDFGELEIPPPPGREELDRVRREMDARKASRLWPPGSISACPECSRRAFVGRDDLSYELARPGGVVIFRHLRGARCENCQAQALEPGDLVEVEAVVGVGIVADYEAKVSNIGSGTVGTYWPKDVVRVMGLNPDKKAFIQVLDKDTALIKFRRVRSSTSGKTSRSRKRNTER